MTREEIVTRILKNLDELKERPLWLAYIEDAMLKVFSYYNLSNSTSFAPFLVADNTLIFHSSWNTKLSPDDGIRPNTQDNQELIV